MAESKPKDATDPHDAHAPKVGTAAEQGRHQHDQPVSAHHDADTYDAAIDQIARGVEKLCKAGMGGAEAGRLACDVYCVTRGHQAVYGTKDK